jgi:flagellar biosynthesis protein FlhG
MNWDQARKLLHLAADAGGDGTAVSEAVFDPGAEAVDTSRAASLCVASGKGGTGKSVVTASIATLFARKVRTLIVDADLGVGNAHILQNVTPELSFVDVVDGRLSVREIRVECRENLDLLGGGSGVSRMAGLSSWEMHMIACGIEAVESEYRRLLVDSAAGISNQTIAFAAASDVVLIVTTPDVTALTDAYAFLKALWQRRGDCEPLFAVNRATSEEEAQHVAERMIGVSRKFLGREPRFAGALPEDRAVVRSVNERVPTVISEPESPFARAVERLSVRLTEEIDRQRPRGLGRSLLRTAGYTPAAIGEARSRVSPGKP